MGAEQERTGGEGVQNKKTFCGESMDIFWNYTFQIKLEPRNVAF